MKQKKLLKILSCSVFAGLYIIVAVISLICSTEFFKLAHSGTMSWVLAIGFEIGAMSCLLSTLILPKNKLGLVWFMFVVLTLFQCMGNMYAAFVHLENFKDWIDMFGMSDMEIISQKRVLAAISGVILPLVALGFIRIMADVLQDGHQIIINDTDDLNNNQPLKILQETANTSDMHLNTQEANITPGLMVNPEPVKEVKKKEPEKVEPVKEVKKKDKVEPVKEAKQEEPVKEVKQEEPVKEVKKNEPEKVEPVKEVKQEEPVKEAKQEEPVKEAKQEEAGIANKNIGKVWSPALNAEIG